MLFDVKFPPPSASIKSCPRGGEGVCSNEYDPMIYQEMLLSRIEEPRLRPGSQQTHVGLSLSPGQLINSNQYNNTCAVCTGFLFVFTSCTVSEEFVQLILSLRKCTVYSTFRSNI